MRQRGRSFAYILEHTDYDDVMDVARAIKAYEISMAGGQEIIRQEVISMELRRLDELQAELWDIVDTEQWKYNKDGDAIERDYSAAINASRTILSVMKQRAELLGLNEIDPSSSQTTVVLVQGERADYVQKLKEIVEAD